MLPRKIISEDKQKFFSGFEKIAKFVGKSYGPGGSNCAIARPHSTALFTNDGVTIAKSFHLMDEIEDIGAGLIRDAAFEADQAQGDGTTTTTVLAHGLFKIIKPSLYTEEGLCIGNKKETLQQLDEMEASVVKSLESQKKEVSEDEDLVRLATVAVESKDLGRKIGNLYSQVGKDGYVHVDLDYGNEITHKFVPGYHHEVGLGTPAFAVHNFTTELPNPHIIVFKEKVVAENINDIVAALSTIKPHSVIIFAPDFDDDVMNSLAYTFSTSTLFKNGKNTPIIPVKLPATYREIIIRDLCALGACNPVENKITEDNISQPFTGAVLKKNSTYLIGYPNDITFYIDDLKTQANDMSKADQERMKKRIAKITGHIGTIKVGGETDAERMYWYHKIKDCVNSVGGAIEQGFVLGGGIALKNTLVPGCDYPHKLLSQNLGEEFKEDPNIIDSYPVVLNAVKKAFATVRQLIQTDMFSANKRLSVEEEIKIEMNS